MTAAFSSLSPRDERARISADERGNNSTKWPGYYETEMHPSRSAAPAVLLTLLFNARAHRSVGARKPCRHALL